MKKRFSPVWIYSYLGLQVFLIFFLLTVVINAGVSQNNYVSQLNQQYGDQDYVITTDHRQPSEALNLKTVGLLEERDMDAQLLAHQVFMMDGSQGYEELHVLYTSALTRGQFWLGSKLKSRVNPVDLESIFAGRKLDKKLADQDLPRSLKADRVHLSLYTTLNRDELLILPYTYFNEQDGQALHLLHLPLSQELNAQELQELKEELYNNIEANYSFQKPIAFFDQVSRHDTEIFRFFSQISLILLLQLFIALPSFVLFELNRTRKDLAIKMVLGAKLSQVFWEVTHSMNIRLLVSGLLAFALASLFTLYGPTFSESLIDYHLSYHAPLCVFLAFVLLLGMANFLAYRYLQNLSPGRILKED